MLERLRKGIVESYVGTIALGWLLADVVTHFANIFASPVASWVSRREYREMPLPSHLSFSQDFLLRDALPELIRTVLIFGAWYVLLYWLYLRPLKEKRAESHSSIEISG